MGKLWAKGHELNTVVEAFTVGMDWQLDARLLTADVLGSLAHAAMLQSIDILKPEQAAAIRKGLLQILDDYKNDRFVITVADEDCHTAIENRLVDLTGEAGKRIHAGRSRNDQVLTALRLWMRHALFHLTETALETVSALLDLAQAYKGVPMPGRTHMQPAMPSTVELWAGGFAEQLLDDARGLTGLYETMDQCPLGSGAGYGVPLPLNREMLADLLGFSRVQNTVTWCGLSRGKQESRLIDAVEQAALTLSKMATDLILFSMPEFGWISLPEELCTGSSIMPQKRNPDGLELMRAKAASVGAMSVQVKGVIRSLPSGYNRDFQETKEPVMRAVDTVLDMLKVSTLTVRNLTVNRDRMEAAFDNGIYAADAAMALTARGMSFRDAYREVAAHPEKYTAEGSMAERSSTGTAGNPCLDTARTGLDELASAMHTRRNLADKALRALAGQAVDPFG